jgi:tRNA pseudouridine55 synthase
VRVVCSKGTYIRALARDIGIALNTGAHLTALRRTRVGDITADMCLSVDDMAELIRTTTIEMPDDFSQN